MAKKPVRIPTNRKSVKSRAKTRPVRLAQTVGPAQNRLRSFFEKIAGKTGPVNAKKLSAADERALLDKAARGDKAALKARKKILGF